MTRPRLALILPSAFAALALVAGCADTVDGTADTAGVSAPTSPGTSDTSSVPSTSSVPTTSQAPSTSSTSGTNAAFPQSVPELAAFMLSGTSKLTSAHISFDFDAAGAKISAEGDQKLSGGKTTDYGLVEDVPGVGTLEIRVVHGTIYIKDPTRKGTKPWTRITANSSDPRLQQLYTSLQSSSSFSSLESVTLFLRAATGLKYLGTDSIDGDTVGRYSFTVDVNRLPSDFPNKSALVAGGLTKIPVEIAVDTEGRTRTGKDTVTVGGTSATVTFELSEFNKPVTIEAPPASQTTTS